MDPIGYLRNEENSNVRQANLISTIDVQDEFDLIIRMYYNFFLRHAYIIRAEVNECIWESKQALKCCLH